MEVFFDPLLAHSKVWPHVMAVDDHHFPPLFVELTWGGVLHGNFGKAGDYHFGDHGLRLL